MHTPELPTNNACQHSNEMDGHRAVKGEDEPIKIVICLQVFVLNKKTGEFKMPNICIASSYMQPFLHFKTQEQMFPLKEAPLIRH